MSPFLGCKASVEVLKMLILELVFTSQLCENWIKLTIGSGTIYHTTLVDCLDSNAILKQNTAKPFTIEVKLKVVICMNKILKLLVKQQQSVPW